MGGGAVVLLLAAFLLYGRSSAGKAQIPTHVQVHGACLACGARPALTPPTREAPPFKCPDCGQPAAYPQVFCPACKVLFVPEPQHREDDPLPRMPVIPVCPKCGGHEAHSYNPGFDGEGHELLPLPKWPIP